MQGIVYSPGISWPIRKTGASPGLVVTLQSARLSANGLFGLVQLANFFGFDTVPL